MKKSAYPELLELLPTITREEEHRALLEIAKHHPTLVLHTIKAIRESSKAPAPELCGKPIPHDTYTKVVKLIRDGVLIEAIKELRAGTGCGLKEGKDWVEAHRDSMAQMGDRP